MHRYRPVPSTNSRYIINITVARKGSFWEAFANEEGAVGARHFDKITAISNAKVNGLIAVAQGWKHSGKQADYDAIEFAVREI